MINLIDPATNKSSSKRAFESRSNYKYVVTNAIQELGESNRYIDLWYDKPLYGKINLKGDAVYNIQESTLQQIPASKNLFALDFVVEAYKDMRAVLVDLIEKGQMPPEIGELNEISPKRAWVSSAALFSEQLESLLDLFISNYLVRNENHIKEFKDILPHYESFIKNHAKDFPLSYSTFIESQLCPPQTTGLIIELLESKHGDEGVNIDMFNAFGFDKFVSLAAKFGFYVNQNAPWALVANLSSPRMHKYMADFGLESPRDIFDEYYWPAYKLDMSLMKDFLFDAYNAFIEKRPQGKMRRVSKRGGFSVQRFARTPLTREQYDATLDIEYWFRICAMIKAEEIQVDIHPTTMNRLIERLMYFTNRDNNMDVALDHMNKFFKVRNPRINLLLEGAPDIPSSERELPRVLDISNVTPTPMLTYVPNVPTGGGGSGGGSSY
tara:strand:+ start:1517 stop:2830 length:1314 start_codon:yes stop_codon:yes gene_type:complete